jgi:hypothetical protein
VKVLYAPPNGRPVVVNVPPMQFLMVDGRGDPNTAQAYREAVETLYSLAFALKVALRRDQGLDYRVMPLEGLWWSPNLTEFSLERKGEWLWTAMICQPACVTPDAYEHAVEHARTNRPLPALDRLRFETFHEGLAAQVLYFGPYAEEGPTIQRLHAFIREQGGVLTGKHHEIYLGDPRRAAPDNLRTIIRQPMRRV